MDLQCYKHVCALLVRSLKRSQPAQRLNTVYVLSAICRQSKLQLKGKDKYGAPRIARDIALRQMLLCANTSLVPSTSACPPLPLISDTALSTAVQCKGYCHRWWRSSHCWRRFPAISTCAAPHCIPSQTVHQLALLRLGGLPMYARCTGALLEAGVRTAVAAR